MSYGPYCLNCAKEDIKSAYRLQWGGDFSTEDFGFETDGIIGVYHCPHCSITYEVIDFFLEDEKDLRVIKYYDDFENESIEISTTEADMISTCIYCATGLYEVSKKPIEEDIYNYACEVSEEEGIKTEMKCPSCETIYEVIDAYPAEELYMDNQLSKYETRTVFLKY